MSSSPAVSLRRNGTLQSCERCRKNKVKCDHSTPSCGRCLAKDTDCVYAAAPTTRRFRVAQFDASSGRVRTARAQDAEGDGDVALESQGQPGPEQQQRQQTALSPDRHPDLPVPSPTVSPEAIEITTPPVQTSGFVGPGSYRDLPDYSGAAAASPGTTNHTIDRKRLDLGLQILDFLLEHGALLQNQVNYVHRVIRMPIVPPKIMLPAVESLFSTIRNDIPPNDSDAKLRMVIRIFQNSYQPIRSTKHTTVDEICQEITGENLRWETIGNVLVIAGLCLILIPLRDFAQLDSQRRNKDDLMHSFHDIADVLTTMTSVSPVLNELGVCLKFNQFLLALCRFGDSSQRLYSIFMELTSSIYATGMHQDRAEGPDPTERTGFMYQWRRRCFTSVFSMDKIIATNLGRPPLISRNYCVLDAPLDLDDDDLTGPGLEHALEKLDGNGWNTDGRRRSTTYMRLRYLLATVREEVLELHLGVNTCVAPGRAELVLQNLQSIWDSCPEAMKYTPAVWTAGMCPHEIWFLIQFYMDYLYSIFLIYRFNARHDQSVETLAGLLSAAKSVLSTVLAFNEHRETMRQVRNDFSSIFLPYGLPCADILAMELLYRPEMFSRFDSGIDGGSGIVRAELIRELTVYISCLSWMPGRDGNSVSFSREVQERLTKVLDQIIDSSSDSPSPAYAMTGLQDARLRVGMMADVPDTAGPNFNHLFFDWDTTMYLDSQLDLFSQSLM
ncbi:hypothetical protein B0T16DRAFT_414174 [Cercophora newfieldiana]|uniref:Zn(2)-C6 fungal-type domain-containing protein n=1 Tax=Cercophora newfieldiana TaxID=92897 RepID=A0AA40CPP0_9PEZI|nr:hypothetical protein B0T16DRAFT_414174 [Cercophora newfieldiana]